MAADAAGAAESPPDAPSPIGRIGALRHAYDLLHADAYDEAEAISRPYAAPDDIEHSMLLAMALGMRGETEESGTLFARVAAARAEGGFPVDDLARLLRERGRADEAIAHTARAVALRPHDHRALGAHAVQLIAMLRPAEAEPLLRRALALAPGNFGHVNQLGIALTDQGYGALAAEQFRLSVSIEPDNNVAWTNLGCVLTNSGAFDDALSYYRRAIMLRPDNPSIRVNHAICLLKAGRTAQGWSEYEWRLRTPNHTDLPVDRLLPSLDDRVRLDDRIVLVTQEEGLGDTLQFMRHLAPLRARGARVIAWVPAALQRLIAEIDGIEVFRGRIEDLVYHYHCPFISLPRVFAATAEAMPVAPYLRIDPATEARMAAHLPRTEALTVGLVWGGAPRPEHRSAFAVDRRRSMGAAPLVRPLATVPNVRFVSLQLGPYRDELRLLGDRLDIVDPMEASRDLHDTGALIRGLDLVVSVDTSVVHLAAGLGAPTILLDRHDNCWRWLYGRDDSPAYPSLRLIRQPRPGAWDDVAERLAAVLTLLSDGKRARGGARLGVPDLHRAMDAIGRFGTVVAA